ncbi:MULTISPECIES: ATP-binding protein [Streptomyces]|uniref:ATP-binding protein n=1 Tax=Streptomyces TaxID=1883 RepID=UPI001F1B47A8|nr:MULTISPECIES: ATP-binding protein [Streptomyces]
MGFQTACALLQLIRLPEQYPEADTFRVEGADEAIDFEVRDVEGRPLLLAQAKTRVEPGTWSGGELLRLARRWGAADPDGSAVLRFLSDAPVHSSGKALRDVAERARAVPDPARWLVECQGLVPSSVALVPEDHALLRRLEIVSRIGPWEQILDQARLELLRLSAVPLAAAEVDSTIDALFVKLFQHSGDHRLDRRTLRLEELPWLVRGRRTTPGAEPGGRPARGRALLRDVPSAAGVRGRDEELAALQGQFGQDPDAGAVRVVMSGLGGIGKSSIARLYAHRSRDAYEFVWWIPSDTREDVLASYRRMLAEEQQETGPADEAEILAQIGLRLAHLGSRVLLIYDNVAGREQLNGLLPDCDGAHVLVTTRDSAWAAAEGGLVVERMAAAEAAAWAGERLQAATGTEVAALVDAVEGIPLAIAQATGYIAATQCPVDVYLAELARFRARLLDEPGFVPLDYRHGVTLTAAVALSVRRVLDQALSSPEASGRHLAGEVLARCALLAPDFIPLHLATLDLPGGSAVYGAVAELRRFSLVDPRDGVLAIHRIVQEIVRASLDGEAVDMMQHRFQRKLVIGLADCRKRESWSEAATLIEHAVHVARHVRSSGFADSDTVAVLSNVAGAIMTVHGDLVRTEGLLREALEVIEQADEGVVDDPVYRRAATTTSLAQCLLNQTRFVEAADAARTGWQLLEGVGTLDADGAEHLLLAYTADMRAAVALDRYSDIALAHARIEDALRRLDVPSEVVLRVRLEQAQVLIWNQSWDDAALVIDRAKEDAPTEAAASVELQFLEAIVHASTGRLEEALAVTAGIPEPAERVAVAVLRHHTEQMVESAHAVMVGSQARHEAGLPVEAWILQAAESMIDRAEALLKEHIDAGPEALAPIVHRRAILAMTRYLVGHAEGLAECGALMRESLELFEAAGHGNVPLAATARRYLEIEEQDFAVDPGEEAGGSGPRLVPPPPSGVGGPHRMPDYPWRDAVALTRVAPANARRLYSLIGATAYHLGGQAAPSSLFLASAFASALRALGEKSRLVPVTVRVLRGDGEALDLPEWQLPPVATGDGELLGQVAVWCEGFGRLVDPGLLLGQSWFGPGAAERAVFEAPAVFPAPALEALVGISLASHRDGHLLTYELHPGWGELLAAATEHLDQASVDAFAQVLVASAALAADGGSRS